MDIYELLEQVKNKRSFLLFLRSLARDSETNPDEWENRTIAAYLESIAAWMESDDKGVISNTDLKEMATAFYVGKIYE